MRSIFFLTLLLLLLGVRETSAQGNVRIVSIKQAPADSINPADPAFRARYEKISFGDQFSLAVLSDQTNTYYIVDFSKLASRFEKVWFLNLVFAQDKVVNIDSQIESDRVWFLASNQYPQKDVQELFLSLKKQTLEQSAAMSAGEQEKWLQSHDKYK